MSNEIRHDFPSGNNLYAFVRKKTNDQIFDENDGGDTFEAWVNGNVANYDIPMADNGGDNYSVDFPAVITTAGVYRVTVSLRAGATAAIGDARLAQGEIAWDGSAEIDIFAIDTKIDDDVIGTDGDTLESLSDQMDTVSQQANTVFNRYGIGE